MKEKGFTLVELLAVIVILAIILIIAVPQIINTIKDARIATFESNAKLIATSAEKRYLENETLEIEQTITCEDVAVLIPDDYASCSVTIIGREAKVTIVGKGKFKGMNVCNGTKTVSTVTENECIDNDNSVCKDDTATYEVNDYDSCISYFRPKIVEEWGNTEDDLNNLCKGEKMYDMTFSESIESFINGGFFTEQELIENNVTKKCTK